MVRVHMGGHPGHAGADQGMNHGSNGASTTRSASMGFGTRADKLITQQ